MKFILLAVTLLLTACDKPPKPKIAEPQREALEKAQSVEQAVQKGAEASKQEIEDATQ